MTNDKPIRLDVLRAKQRPPDVVFTVEFWRIGEKWWHEPYSLASCVGELPPVEIRMVAHAIADDANHLWDSSGSHRPPRRKVVKQRRGRRR